MTAESDLLASRMLPVVDRLIDLALVQSDIPAACRVLGGMDRAELGVFLGALAYRAVSESPFVDRPFWPCPQDLPFAENDPELAGFRIICAAGSHDNDMAVALAEVLMDRGLIAVGIAVRTMLIVIREGIHWRAFGGAM